MAPKRDREEDEQPVAARGGAGVEAPTGGHLLTIDTLMQKIAQLQEQIVNKDKKIKMLDEEVMNKDQEMYQQLRSRDNAVDIKDHELKEAKKSAKDSLNRYFEEAKKVNSLEQTIRAQAEETRRKSYLQNQAGPQIANRASEIRALEDQLAEKSTQLTVEQRIVATLRRRIAELENPNGPKTISLAAALPVQVQVPKAQLEAARAQFRKRLDEKEKEIEELNKKYEYLEGDYADLNKEVDDLTEQAAELNETIDLDRQQIQELKDKNKELSASAQSARHKATALSAHLNGEITNLKNQITDLTVDVDCEKQEKIDSLHRVRELEDRIIETEKEHDALIEQYDAQIEQYEAQIEQYEAQIEQHDAQVEQYDNQIEQYDAQIEQYDNQIEQYDAQIEQYEVDIKQYEAEIKQYKTQTNQSDTSIQEAQKAQDQAKAQIDHLNGVIAGLNTQLGSSQKEKQRLGQEVQDLKQAVDGYKQQLGGEQRNSTQFKQQYQQLHDNTSKLQNKVGELEQTVLNYQTIIQEHVCDPVQDTPAATPVLSFSRIQSVSTAPVSPPAPPVSTTAQSTTPAPAAHAVGGWNDWDTPLVKLTDLLADWHLNLDEDKGSSIIITVNDQDAPAPAAEAHSFACSGSSSPSSSPLSTEPFSPPTPSTTSTTSSPPTTPTRPPPPPLTSYDAREDVPDIDSWWFDPQQFDEGWQPRTFEFRRARPYCDDCRTRRALRLVDDRWELPENFNRKIPCAEHSQPWYPPTKRLVWRRGQWNPHCADCVETDARASGQEDQLPAQLREDLACRDHGCQWVIHDRREAEARFALAEHYRRIQEREAARLLHEQRLDEYRAIYGKYWPTFKGDVPPKNFAYGAVSYGTVAQ